MATLESRIHAASKRNTELLTTLKETDHGAPDLASQNRYIADLEAQASHAAKRIAAIERKRQKELKEHESYRDSVMKRFAYKVSGKKDKFEERANKEEHEYFEVLQEEHREKEMQKNLVASLADAKRARTDLQGVVRRHQEAQKELDALYEGIFQGQSPGFPEEDQREQDKDHALVVYHDARTMFESENQAVRTMGLAQRAMNSAIQSMEDALTYSRRDMFGGGTITDMMERNSLQKADTSISEARMYLMRAQRMSPGIQDLPPVNIAQGNLMSDVFFDNIFTDMAFHDKIKQSMSEVLGCAEFLNREAISANSRAQGLSWNLKDKEQKLEQARLALQKAREAAFEKTVSGRGPEAGESSEQPPPYQP